MLAIKSWRHLETPSDCQLFFSASHGPAIEKFKLGTPGTQSRALRYAFLLVVIKYGILGYTFRRYWEQKQNRAKKEPEVIREKTADGPA
ncbi:hypothetical protein WN55_05005 [Dufourea novaeangliae]|uniref:Uncharacterized protein n=1 Tax=Dufourea novaeangliae TaxID=178035 RepID=A0A154PPU5_DUFNO|nr:hypothetical protein WN55_05005 [Dufourea novaeangliae]